ncbi:chaplin [Streptomyces violascens]|uniref:chaplin n=1 Tax=Streptomyces violascens TaxID=67381 RepID=UPI0037B366B7
MVRIRTALAATALAATAVMGAAGTAAANDPPPTGQADHSPGVLSGDVIQIPIHIPVNVCGDSINVIGLLNPASNNTCTNH